MEDLHSETEEGSPGAGYQEMLAKLVSFMSLNKLRVATMP